MGVLLLFLLLRVALQATTPPALWRSLAAAAPGPGSSRARCSTSGSVTTSAASPPARAATAPCTCRLQGEERRQNNCYLHAALRGRFTGFRKLWKSFRKPEKYWSGHFKGKKWGWSGLWVQLSVDHKHKTVESSSKTTLIRGNFVWIHHMTSSHQSTQNYSDSLTLHTNTYEHVYELSFMQLTHN